MRHTEQLTDIELAALDAGETAALATHIAGHTLDPVFAARLYAETEGNPLFVVEMVRARPANMPTGALPAGYVVPQFQSLPPRVQSVIESRLAQLSPAARQLADLSAMPGREFRVDVLAQATESDADTFVRALDELWQHRIVREQGGDSYDFSHDKIREVVVTGMTLARKRLLHRRVVQALELFYAANRDAVSGQLVFHYERAGMRAQAIPYYQRAGELAQRVYANEEAITYLSRGLDLLPGLPENREWADREIALCTALGPSLIAARGYAAPEVQQIYARARAVCEQIENTRRLFPVLWGLWVFYTVREELHTAHELGEQCLHLAHMHDDPAALVAAYFAAGNSLFHLGKLVRAHAYLDAALVRYSP